MQRTSTTCGVWDASTPSRLHSLVMTDSVRTLLEWLDDPDATAAASQGARWDAFVEACRSTYGFDPAKDGAAHGGGTPRCP